MRRQKMNRGRSRRVFSKTAGRAHARNFSPAPMRGGIRL